MDDILAVCTDLYFQSRILAAARAAGRQVRFVTSSGDLGTPSLALIDLDAQADVMSLIGAFKPAMRGPIVAFGPHLDTGRRKAARAAGADRVLAKSRFVEVLPDLVRAGPPADVAEDSPAR